MKHTTLESYLKSNLSVMGAASEDVVDTILRLSKTAVSVRALIAEGCLDPSFSGQDNTRNADGDIQKNFDIIADEAFLEALKGGALAYYGSEEREDAILLNPHGKVALAIDPLDGSSNIDTNVSIGTIFSILPVTGSEPNDGLSHFMQPGSRQLAAGFFVYGPQLALVVTIGAGTRIFIYSSEKGEFQEAFEAVSIPEKTGEFAINASNYRNWEDGIRQYIDDCMTGTGGPREQNFNMRWIASLVADTYRILVRGGIFLYPADNRKSYANGRLRLVYEANPIAFIVEQAGGKATNCVDRILDLVPENLHQRVPLVFGSSKEVELVERYSIDSNLMGERSPLFGNRGLFRT